MDTELGLGVEGPRGDPGSNNAAAAGVFAGPLLGLED